MPTYITLGNLRIAGVAAMWQGKGRGPVNQPLDTGDGLAAAPMRHQDCITLGPQSIGPEGSPTPKHQFHCYRPLHHATAEIHSA